MSSPVYVKLGYPWTSKKRTSLGSVKNLGKIKNLTSLLAHNFHRTFYVYPVNENPSVRLASATDILLMECFDQENWSILGCPMDGHRYQSGM